MRWGFKLALASILLSVLPLSMSSVIAQNSQDVLSPSDSSLTFDAPSSSISPFFGRYQQVYAASDFSSVLPAGGFIQGLLFRLDTPEGFSRQTFVTNLQIHASTTQRSSDSLSPVFAENLGADATLVESAIMREILFGYSDVPSASSAQSFTIAFGFDSPFFYDPAAGNLLVDFRTDVFYAPFGASPLDAWRRSGDSVGRVFGGVGATTGTADTTGLVTEFIVQPIPEPSQWLFLAAGALAFWIMKRKRRTA